METPKKILLSAISALLIATTVFGSATFASEEIPEGSSLESIRKFNEYIASLPEENAQLILEDQEMVANMKLDSYWAEPDENAVSTQGLVRVFPLDQYPAGSYFTVNGKACTCHTFSSNPCIYKASNSTTNCTHETKGTDGNCKAYEGTASIQCKAFADYIYYFGTMHDIGNAYSVSTTGYTSISNNASGAAKMKAFFENLPSGTDVRLVNRSGGRHSIITAGTDSANTGIYVYDANWTGICQIGYKFRTWEFLASKFSGIQGAWTPGVQS